MPAIPFHLQSPGIFAAAALLALCIILIAAVRRPAVPALTYCLAFAGLIGLALAAGGVMWHRPAPGEIAVMVDLSPSTRGAAYRERSFLHQRIDQLLGDAPHRLQFFAGGAPIAQPASGTAAALHDIPADRTLFSPPAAAAVLLFSDGRFELPAAAPPTFIAVDPALEQPADAAVIRLEQRGEALAATVRNTGPPRQLTLTGTAGEPTATIDRGTFTITRPLPHDAAIATAQLDGGDLWPENDALSIHLAPPPHAQRWWIGRSDPGGAWIRHNPANLPADSAAYLAPAIIVLDNIAADELLPLQQQRLRQYVRDLGGALLILGGERAFAAGGYPGSILESISPLASTPPQPAIHWILLADSSGSMAARTGSSTHWDMAAAALVRLLGHLPPQDPLSIGSFAAELRWWSTGRTAEETARLSLAPPDVRPHGPTNLQAALEQIARGPDELPVELLLLTDADAEIDDPDALAAALAERRVRVHLLAAAAVTLDHPVRRIVEATGGTTIEQSNPRQWIESARHLARAAAPDELGDQPVQVSFTAAAGGLPPRTVVLWNRTWMKDAAAPLAYAEAADQRLILSARWRYGAGQVIAAGFAATMDEANALADLIAAEPRDPRFTITWRAGPRLQVMIDAIDEGEYLNELPLQIELLPHSPAAAPRIHDIPQSAPGRYSLSLPAPTASVFATIVHDGRPIDRIAVAGRYPPEFDQVGNDRAAMEELARRTGGRIIEAHETHPIHFDWPRQRIPLAPWLAAAAAILIAASLTWWRRQ